MAQAAEKMMEMESFEALLNESLGENEGFEGTVVKGRIIGLDKECALIDVGLKSEGRVALREFAAPGQDPELAIGDMVDVFVERMEDRNGEVMLSRDKARREESWQVLEKQFEAGENVNGVIFNRVKGGFTVDLNGAVAFLPGSQVDIRPVKDVSPLMGTPQPFQILKMDRSRGNIVVSRRAVLEESRAEARADLIKGLQEGQVLQGIVKNITDYGAFVDLGGVDGLLHVTDICWKRINHPNEVLSVGQSIEVQVIRFNEDSNRISLGMKQLETDPWEKAQERFKLGDKVKGTVTNVTDYGAFVELGDGIEGLVHVSEMSWTKKNVHPGKIISTSQEIEVMVLDIDTEKRRISLGLKQCTENPWESFSSKFSIGDEITGEIRNITEFGLFVAMPGDIEGMVHISDLDWERSGEEAIADYKKGDMLKVRVLDIDTDKERVSLGVKQLGGDPFHDAISGMKKGAVVTCTITAVMDGGIEVEVGEGAQGFIRKGDLSRDRSEQRSDRFAVGEKVDAKITNIDRANRRLALSIKAKEVAEEKEAMAEFGSTESGASLGDILGAALKKSSTDKEKAPTKKATAKKAPAKKAAAKKEADASEDKAEAKPKKAAAKKAASKTTAKSKEDTADKAE